MSIRIEIGSRAIGEGEPVFIIAEVGSNFNTLEEGLKSIDAAVECGADAVKFQTFRASTVTQRDAHFPGETAGGQSQYELFVKYELSEEWHRKLFDYARKKGIIVFSTTGHQTDVDLLEKFDMPLYKIGSDDCTNLPLLKYVAEKGKPVILATGMSDLAEATEAVETVLSHGNGQLVVLHTVSNYPVTDVSNLNLRAMLTLKNTFGDRVLVGYSDHTTSLTIPVAAVAMGARVYERHFTIDKNLDAPDAFLSADPADMKAIIDGIREYERALGDGVKKPAASEISMRRDTRKSLIALTAIRSGEVITADKIIVKRPGHGIPPGEFDAVTGRKAAVDIAEDEIITWDKIQPGPGQER